MASRGHLPREVLKRGQIYRATAVRAKPMREKFRAKESLLLAPALRSARRGASQKRTRSRELLDSELDELPLVLTSLLQNGAVLTSDHGTESIL